MTMFAVTQSKMSAVNKKIKPNQGKHESTDKEWITIQRMVQALNTHDSNQEQYKMVHSARVHIISVVSRTLQL